MLVTQHAERHAGTGDDGKLDGSAETLVTLGVIVLEADLELFGHPLVQGRVFGDQAGF